MTWLQAAWLAAGLVLGIVHAAGIRHSATRPGAMTALVGLVRLLIVALALAAAASLGGILPMAAGWVTGFFATVGLLMATRSRSRERRTAP